MADQHNVNIPDLSNSIAADVADIKENLEWHKDLLQMLLGWKDSTIASVSPPLHRAKFLWKDADEIYIDPGAYFHDGTTRQSVFWDAQITFQLGSAGSNAASDDLGVSEWHYIYLDDTAIITQGASELDADCFLNDTTAPSWSNAKHGFYNGSDRCIFAVLTAPGHNILEFLNDGELVVYTDSIADYANANIASDWSTEITLTIPAFARRASVVFRYIYVDSAIAVSWRTEGQAASVGHLIGNVASNGVYASAITDVICSSNLKIDVKDASASTNTLRCDTNGWYFPIGM